MSVAMAMGMMWSGALCANDLSEGGQSQGTAAAEDYFCIKNENGSSKSARWSLSVKKVDSAVEDVNMQFSKNATDWEKLSIGTTLVLNPAECGCIYLRAESPISSLKGYRINVGGLGNGRLMGNIMSLLDPTMQQDTLADGAFYQLFANSTKLADASKLSLPVTKLGEGCYEGMFSGCKALLMAPTLPAEVLAKNCYKDMFLGCAKLQSAPELIAPELAEGCYKNMFNGCAALTELIAYFDNWEVKDATTGWLSGVADKGTFHYKGKSDIARSENTVPAGWVVNPDYFCLTAKDEGARMIIDKKDKSANISLQYSMDGLQWQNYFFNTALTFGKDKKIYWRAKEVNANLDGISFHALDKAPVIASGNIMSLLDVSVVQTKVPARAFKGLFEGCQGLTQAPELPFTELGDSCYFEMFKDCSALTTAPELPATELTTSCYQCMFEWCKKLVNVPDFPAAQMGRYSCYKMFSFCKSLENAPALPVTALAPNCCASMFEQCESLTHAPVLPNVELADSCYRSMFWYCKKLNTIYAEFTHALPSADAVSFFYTAPEGTFYCPEALTKDSNFYYIALETKWKVYSYKTEVQLLNNGYASYASPLDMQIVDGGVAVYATERDFAVYVSEIDSVPANQGVLLKGEPNGIVHLKKLGEVRPAAKGGQADNELYPLVLAYNEVAFAPKQGAVYALVNKGFVLCAQDGVFEGVNGKSLFNESQSYLVLDKVLDAPYLPILTSDDERRTFDVTISDCGYTTLCLPYNARGPEGVTIYSLRSADQSGLHFAHVEAIIAKKGYVVAGTPGETYTFTEVFDNHADSKNLLQGVTERTYRTDLLFTHTEFLDYPWILAKDGLFKRYIGDYIPANKAYVDARRIKDALTDINEASAFRIILDEEFEEETTGITALTTDTESAPELYSLDGRRVSQPARGTIYIERGKKLVIVK